MDSRAAIVASCWIAVAIMSAMYIYVGGITWATDVIVGILVFIAFIITFAVGFGIEAFRAELREKSPHTKTQAQISSELTEIKITIGDLAKKVEAIQREISE